MFSITGAHRSVYIPFQLFTDGQPHVKIPIKDIPNHATIFGRITNANDLLALQLIVDVLRFNGKNDLNLQLSYLMGARMDREASEGEPSTLKVVCEVINRLKFNSIELFDVHSYVAQTLLRARNVLPIEQVRYILGNTSKNRESVVVIPDAGAANRVKSILHGYNIDTVQCLKTRNSQTQELSDFQVCSPIEFLAGRNCIIIDDICDGGRTFTNLANILKEQYDVRDISLYVSHGIFSYGENLKGIDSIWTTNSYKDMTNYGHSVHVLEAPFTPIPEPTDLRIKGRNIFEII